MNNKPVAWINKTTFQYLTELGYSAKVYPKRSDGDIPLYTHPVKEQDESFDRTASHMAGEYVSYNKELTDEEIIELFESCGYPNTMTGIKKFARAILRKASEK